MSFELDGGCGLDGSNIDGDGDGGVDRIPLASGRQRRPGRLECPGVNGDGEGFQS